MLPKRQPEQSQRAKRTYYAIVISFMVVGPIASMLIEPMVTNTPFDFWLLLGRWFVFWAVGVRLFTAGIRQIVQPRFTAETIFGTTDPGALKIVPELGFANVAAGAVAIASIALPGFVLPIAIYGALFYGFATLQHLCNSHHTRTEMVALISDGWITAILAAFVLSRIFGW